ncbi:MAG: SPFH domain-containing protein [Clostridia bacterium]|nr:SPFH domain-containing protein [Clostridia bacterium]
MKLYDIIVWDPSSDSANDVVCYKHEAEDFNTHTQLIVHQSQEAVFFKDGRALDLFGPGKHTLKTENIPLLKKLVNIPTDGKTPFHCEVYFVNKVYQVDMKWGAPSLQTEDPVYGIIVNVGASGTCGAQIKDSRKFLTKLVGTRGVYTRSDLTQFLRSSIIMNIKDALGRIMNKNKISFLQATTEIKSYSREVMGMLNEVFAEYGIEILKFDWETLSVPQEDLKPLKDAKNRAITRAVEGYTYQQEQNFDVMKRAASNQGMAGTMMGAGMGFGMGAGMGMPMGMSMGNIAQNTVGQMNAQPQAQQQPAGVNACPSCGSSVVAGAKFCPSCGTKVAAPAKKFCIECGTEIADGMKFCPSCGHKTEG